jgi:hypothetical protein
MRYQRRTDGSDGGSAYPFQGDGDYTAELGMTLLDYFAGQALVGLCTDMDDKLDTGNIPIACYLLADAMLKERNKL